MRNLLSSLFFILIFVALGAMAFAAAPRGQEPAQNEVAAQPGAPLAEVTAQENAPAAPTANKYNFIAVPLDVSANFSSFDVAGLVDYVGSGVVSVLSYNATCQGYETWTPNYSIPAASNGYVFDASCGQVRTFAPWPLKSPAGGSYFMLLDANAPSTLSFVGDVPAQGSVDFDLVGAASGCSYNYISVPLDQSSITNVDELAVDMGYADVSTILSYNASCQGYETWTPNASIPSASNGYIFDASCGRVRTFDPADIAVQIGYPYIACLKAGLDGTVWPTTP